MKLHLPASILFTILLLATGPLQAHTLQAVKGTKALVSLDDSKVVLGDVFLVLDAKGAEHAQIQIRQIKDKRAVGYILNGELSQPADSYRLEAVAKELAKVTAASLVPQAKGYYAGLSQNQMSITLTSATNLKLSGTSFNFGAFYERAMTKKIQVLARAGYEGLKASGSLSSNACGASCEVDIGYLGADALVKYSFYQEKKSWWLGGGLGFLLPVLKSSNVLDTGKLSINEKIILGGGLNWYRTPTTFIPVQLEYALQPSNSVVSTSQIILRVGYGQVF